jgi:DMSO/TMAO reductase YedYZ molybdopterin-dependent catalytic subunit
MIEVPPANEPFSLAELQKAARNHGMPLEALRYDITPAGLHYLLIHYDIPVTDDAAWRLEIAGNADRPLSLSMDEIRARPSRTLAVTMECAGNGRARMPNRVRSQPWLVEAVGTAEWTGTPLADVLAEAEIRPGSVEVVFSGVDHGVQGEIEQDYQRSLTLEEAMRADVLLAWAMNGQPLLPQHGAPLRLIVPGWYGMTSVKWLSRIEAVTSPFQGYQQVTAYRIQQSEDDPGEPLSRMKVRALMAPPGIVEFPSTNRLVERGPVALFGRAWSGFGPIARVEVGVDGTWHKADLGAAPGPHAWRPWTWIWQAEPGEHVLSCRATDAAGNSQPLEPFWNLQGMGNNYVQTVPIRVR